MFLTIPDIPSIRGGQTAGSEYRRIFNRVDKQTKFQVRWRWTEGDLAIWDNGSAMHYAAYDFDETHHRMHRIFISGQRPHP